MTNPHVDPPQRAREQEAEQIQIYICDREQCGYTGTEEKGTTAKTVDSAWGLITCGPCAMLIFGGILAIVLGIIHPWLSVVGFIIGAGLVVSTIIGSASRTSCPACKRGHLESVTSERGQALMRRNRTKFGDE